MISITTAFKGRHLLGWKRCRTGYCGLIHAHNCTKRLEWVQQLGGKFEDVIWSDKISVQLETIRHFHCYKKGPKPCYKPRPKHSVKVHVWAAISCRTHHVVHGHFLQKNQSTGGKLHQRVLMPTQLKTCGMN